MEQEIRNQIRNRVEEALGEPKKERSEYQEFISQCMKEKGGGTEAMKVCAAEWKGREKNDKKEKIEEKTFNDEEEHVNLIEKVANEIKEKAKHTSTILIVSEKCPVCEQLLEYIDVNDDRILTCPISDDECLEIAKSARVQGVPRLLIKEKDGFKQCKISEKGLTCF